MRALLVVFVVGVLLLGLSGCGNSSSSGTTSSSGGGGASPSPSPSPSNVTLNAFSDFSCTSNWTNRDGALGLKAFTGSGTCQTSFPGVSGKYQVIITAQTEFDGQPVYRLSINGVAVRTGTYPLSSSIGCSCPLDKWTTVCPDKNVDLNAGVFQINAGDIIQFYGKEVFACGEHGAYAKWHRMTFIPVQ